MQPTLPVRARTSLVLGLLPLFVLGLVLCSCGDASHARETIRAEPYAFGPLEAGLLGAHVGTRIRYDGPKRVYGFRAVREGADGEVLGSRDMGRSIDDAPLSLDHVAVVTLEEIHVGDERHRRITVRFTGVSGETSLSTHTLVDDWFPEKLGGYSTVTPPAARAPDAVPVFDLGFADGAGRLRVEFYVE